MPSRTHADHAQHDLSLIAGHAAGDLADPQRLDAETLLASCTACSDLRRDLVAIAAATRALPAPAIATRDFQLTAEQAERLRRGSWLRGLLRPFAASRSAVRPLAAAFTTLGIAGLFVATAMPALIGATASMPGGAIERDTTVAGAAPSGPAAAPNAQSTDLAFGAQSSQGIVAYPQAATAEPETDGKSGATPPPFVAVAGGQSPTTGDLGSQESARLAERPMNMLFAGSLALLGIGLVLFGLRLAGRRLR